MPHLVKHEAPALLSGTCGFLYLRGMIMVAAAPELVQAAAAAATHNFEV